MILPFKIKGNLTISGYYSFKKILWIQSLLGPKSEILSPKCAYGGVTGLGLRVLKTTIFYTLPLFQFGKK